MCEEHVHDWVPHLPKADGFFSKRDDGQTNDVQWFTGRVLSCVHQPCGTFLFVPDLAGAQPVECELAVMPKRQAVAA